MLKDLCVLVLLSAGVFVFGNTALNGSLGAPESLSGELKSPPDSLYEWNIGTEAPFKYRLLHRAIVLGTYRLVSEKDNNMLFFRLYQAYALIFHVAAALAFYALLRTLRMGSASFWGTVLFALMPAMLMAYSVPVHTREDMLAYSLLSIGLISIVRNNLAGILTSFFLGVLCRETLLLLPLINLFFNRKQSMRMRGLIFVASIALFVALRLASPSAPYDVWEGLHWNLSHKVQVMGFLFISFGFLWLPFLLWLTGPADRIPEPSFFYRSSSATLAVLVVTTFFGGIYNEIRLLYLLAPWVIIGSMGYYLMNRDRVKQIITAKSYLIFTGILLLAFGAGTFLLVHKLDKIIPPSEHNISYSSWAVITAVQLYFTCVSLPLFAKSVR